eukprot:m.272399 g.272399  ORF g.272399 m.272399 type:complete len:61 (-) comp43986_c0_seq1:278-460(-)
MSSTSRRPASSSFSQTSMYSEQESKGTLHLCRCPAAIALETARAALVLAHSRVRTSNCGP